MRRKQVLLWTVVSGGLLALIACTPAAQAPAQPEKPAGQAPAAQPSEGDERHARLVEAARQEGAVEVWTWNVRSGDRIAAAFNEKYPFINVTLFDSRGDQMLARRAEEAAAGRFTADVWYLTSEIVIARERGYLEEYEFPGTENWQNQPDHNWWRAYTATARPITYNTNTVAPEDVPTSWEQLVDEPERYGKYNFVVTTSGEDSPLYLAAMFGEGRTLEWEKSFDFWRRIVQQYQPGVASGFSGVVELVASGEYDIMPMATSSATQDMINKGAPLEMAPDVSSAQLAANVALAANAPHPNAARLWIDFFNSPEGYVVYLNDVQHMATPGLPEYDNQVTASKELIDRGIRLVVTPEDLVTLENIERSANFYFEELGIRER